MKLPFVETGKTIGGECLGEDWSLFWNPYIHYPMLHNKLS